VGALVYDGERRLLVVRRARQPSAGRWSVPGGRVESGETETEALVREVREETGLEVVVGDAVGRVERPGPGGIVYAISDHACTVVGGTLTAGDDAAEVRWVTYAELVGLPVTYGLLDALRGWGALPS
jgi:8-oxo-dGTP diphosphatase